MTQDNTSQLLTSFIQATTESTREIREGFESVRSYLEVMDENNTRFEADLTSQVNHTLLTVERLSKQVELIINRLDNQATVTRLEYPQADIDDNPFSGEKIARNVQPPKQEGKSLQFNWDYFEALGKNVLEKKKKPWHAHYFTTFKRNVKRFSEQLAYDLKREHHLDPCSTFSDLDKSIQYLAEKKLEEIVGDQYPLNACCESWGAHLIMRKAFFKCKNKNGK